MAEAKPKLASAGKRRWPQKRRGQDEREWQVVNVRSPPVSVIRKVRLPAGNQASDSHRQRRRLSGGRSTTTRREAMAIRLKLLCQASTRAVRSAAFPADEPLDVHGRRKLAAFPLRLGGADRWATSPALCARETAEALKIDAIVEPLLRDCDYGRWTGRSFEAVQAEEPEAVTEWLRNPAAAPHGGESLLALTERVGGWLEAQKAIDGATIVVTHASVIRAAIVHAIEAEPRSFWRIDVAPLSLARLNGGDGRWTLASVGPVRANSRDS
jgi:broad specificity phosphatase PhoE